MRRQKDLHDSRKRQTARRHFHMRKFLRLGKVLLINLVILFLLFEVGAVAVYFVKTHEFFYTRNRNRVRTTRSAFDNDVVNNSAEWLTKFQLHPYFGYTSRVNGPAGIDTVNNLGFDTPYDLPFRKTNPNQFIVGVVGGSVAMGYAQHEIANGVLAAALHKVPGFENKQLVLLNLANASYKQPQQLLIINYLRALGQDFDVVINIDGFNEVADALLNVHAGIDVSMPASHMIVPLIDLADNNASPERISLISDVIKAKGHLVPALEGMDHCRTAICYTFEWIQASYWQRVYDKDSQQLSGLKLGDRRRASIVQVKRIDNTTDEDQIEKTAAGIWADSSLALNELLSPRGIWYFHFLQPNQSYTKHQFGAAEQALAINDKSMFGPGVTAGYQQLIVKLAELQKSGVRIVNGVEVFDDVKSAVYADDCCHYNDFGKKVFAEFVARQVAAALKAGRANNNSGLSLEQLK